MNTVVRMPGTSCNEYRWAAKICPTSSLSDLARCESRYSYPDRLLLLIRNRFSAGTGPHGLISCLNRHEAAMSWREAWQKRRQRTIMHLFTPLLGNLYVIGGGGAGLLLVIIIVVLLLRR